MPSPSPSVEQYRESVPTLEGSRPSSREPEARESRLPARVREQAGPDADDLAAIASDPGLGAPKRAAGDRPRPESRRGERAAPPPQPERAALPAVADAAFDTGSGGMLLLLLGLAAATAAIGGVALARRRSSGR